MNPDKTRIGSPSFFNVFFIISTFPEGYSHCLSTVLDERAKVVVQPRQNQVALGDKKRLGLHRVWATRLRESRIGARAREGGMRREGFPVENLKIHGVWVNGAD